MSIQHYPGPYVPPLNPYGGGYDFGYGGGNYGWDPRAGYVPYGGGYGNPYGYTQPTQVVTKYVPVQLNLPNRLVNSM